MTAAKNATVPIFGEKTIAEVTIVAPIRPPIHDHHGAAQMRSRLGWSRMIVMTMRSATVPPIKLTSEPCSACPSVLPISRFDAA